MAMKLGWLKQKTSADSNRQKCSCLDGWVAPVYLSKEPLKKYKTGQDSSAVKWQRQLRWFDHIERKGTENWVSICRIFVIDSAPGRGSHSKLGTKLTKTICKLSTWKWHSELPSRRHHPTNATASMEWTIKVERLLRNQG